jgi:hypothetical protein
MSPRQSDRRDTIPVTRRAPVRRERSDDGNAFFADPGDGPAHVKDTLAQELAEEFLIAGTSGEDVAEEVFNGEVDEDLGGPFLVSTEEPETGRESESSPVQRALGTSHGESGGKPLRGAGSRTVLPRRRQTTHKKT